ncbi:InlB B-repeat-containing protein [Clostridium vitabionis]|uniref:InlB B-repeat-containing protein n=1 Tax=Clostridium vitabionis TaxID=2784388 RepID=UPI00188C865F|nr:InlB B-repeat-containing protein [Clostridium vitabionis]
MKAKMKLHKLLSLLLALVMVVGLLPAMSMTALAETTKISSVKVRGVTEPKAGSFPTTDGISLGENIEIKSTWCMYDDKSEDYTDEVDLTVPFEGGSKYALLILAKPKDGYAFADDDDIEVRYNGSELFYGEAKRDRDNCFAILPDSAGELAGSMAIWLPFTLEGVHKYPISVTGGKATDDAGTAITQAEEGTEVTLTANAAPSGYIFDKWVVEKGSVHFANANNTTTTFTMPKGFVSVKATYSKTTYTVTFDANGGTGTMTAVPGVSGSYALPANSFTAPAGKQFKGWATSADGEVISGTTIDVTADITLYAIWEEDPTVIKTANCMITAPAAGETPDFTAVAFDSSKYSVVVDHWVLLEGESPYYLTSTDVFEARKSYSVLVTFTENEGYSFDDNTAFTINDTIANGYSHDTKGRRKVTFTVPAESTEYAITVTNGKATAGDGTEITEAEEGTKVTLIAVVAPDGQVFDHWEVESGSVTLADATSETTTFTMPAGAVSVEASYKEAPSYYWCFLDTGRSPHGKIKFDDLSREESSTMGGSFPAGKELTAKAYPDDGYQFKEWQNEYGKVVSKKNPYSFNLNRESWLYAIFEAKAEDVPVTEYAITVTDGKAVSGDTDGISKAAEGAEVTLTADAAPDGQVFDHWEVESGNVTLADANSENTTFTMPAGAVSVRASYFYWCGLYTNRSPYGKIKLDDLFLEESEEMGGWFPAGEKLTANAYPDDGYHFKEWQNKDGNVVSKENPYSFNLNRDSYLYAIFEAEAEDVPVTEYTVTFDAKGHGTAPATETVEDGGMATMPSSLTESGWIFGGWYTDAGCTNAFDFTTPITGSITLFAKWTKNSEGESGSGGSSSSGGGSSSSGGGSSSSGGGSSSGGSYRKVSGTRNQYTGTWRKDSVGWWYHHSGSYPKNEWKLLTWDGTSAWYFFDEAGYMKTGWHLSNGKWYYLGEVSDGTLGAMKTGWVLDPNDAHWYYLNPGDGAMRTGWLEAGGRWYYLNEGKTRPLGAMYRNEKTPDGYIVDDSGAWKR